MSSARVSTACGAEVGRLVWMDMAGFFSLPVVLPVGYRIGERR